MTDEAKTEKLGNQMEQLTEDEKDNASTFWRFMLEGEAIPLSYPEVKRLEDVGLVENLEKLPGRGRYAGRWNATWTDKLAELMKSDIRRVEPTTGDE
jgi:hypothetical protein